jgi:uncharacterized phage protein gp47/JayE
MSTDNTQNKLEKILAAFDADVVAMDDTEFKLEFCDSALDVSVATHAILRGLERTQRATTPKRRSRGKVNHTASLRKPISSSTRYETEARSSFSDGASNNNTSEDDDLSD